MFECHQLLTLYCTADQNVQLARIQYAHPYQRGRQVTCNLIGKAINWNWRAGAAIVTGSLLSGSGGCVAISVEAWSTSVRLPSTT